MTFAIHEDVLRCAGTLSVDEAEGLLQLLQGRSGVKADLSACEHVHAASLQVLLAARVTVLAWPAGADLAAWLQAALQQPD